MIGVCKTVEDVFRVTTKSSREVSKRTLNLIDTSGKEVAVTLWGEEVISTIPFSRSLTISLSSFSLYSGMDLQFYIKTDGAGFKVLCVLSL